MKYTVVYDPAAEAELTRLWLAGPDRKAMTRASDHIDKVLKSDAHIRGTPVAGGRMYLSMPLAVLFKVSQDDRLVTILQVWKVLLQHNGAA